MTRDTPQSRLLTLVDVFEPLSEQELEQLSSHWPEIHLTEGQDLGRLEDAYNQGILIIKTGRVRLYKLGSTNRPLTLVTLPAGTMLNTWHTEGLYLEALKPSTLAYIRRKLLSSLIQDQPEVGIRMIERSAAYVRLLSDRLFDVTHKKVPSRLASLVLTLLDLEGVVSRQGYEIPSLYTHEELGAMIGARRVAVTRAFRLLREAGALEIARRRILVKDTGILQGIAGEER